MERLHSAVVKRDFGSFHSSNLAEQIRQADDDKYMPPDLPVVPPEFKEYLKGPFEGGHGAKKKHFYLEEHCVFLNHGAFGATLKEALEYSQEWQRHAERQPLRFFDRVLFPQLVYVQRRLASFVGCRASDITLLSNVTTAVNAVLQSLKLTKESKIYYLNITYGAVKKAVKCVCTKSGAQFHEEKITFPIQNDEDILDVIDKSLESGTTLAIFDHVPSNYAFIMPVEKITALCHQRGVPVLIDGAHGLGMLPLDLKAIGVDYYTTNAHKWFCAAKGCAFLYVKKDLQPATRGLSVSHGYGSGFQSEFTWTGLRDYTAYLSLHAVLNFWEAVGPKTIRNHNNSLLKEAAKLLMKDWDGDLLAPENMHGSMCCVSLPSAMYKSKQNLTYEDAEIIQNRLYHECNIEVPVKCIQNKLYVRISAHIYNQIEDYQKLAKAMSAMIA